MKPNHCDETKTLTSVSSSTAIDEGAPKGSADHHDRAPASTPAPAPRLKSSSLKTKMKIPPTQKDVRKLFVGGIPRGVSNDDFYEFFSKFGKVIDSVVMFDRETQKPRGFGFITFEDPSVALKLLAMGHEGETPPKGGFTSGRIKMNDRYCEVKASQPKRQNYASASTSTTTRLYSNSKNTSTGTAGSSTCSDVGGGGEEKVPNQIQYQYQYGTGMGRGSGSDSSAEGGNGVMDFPVVDARKNSLNFASAYHDSRTAMYHHPSSNVEHYSYSHSHNNGHAYDHVYDHSDYATMNNHYEYPPAHPHAHTHGHAQPMPHYSNGHGGYYNYPTGAYYNPAMYHYQNFYQGPGTAAPYHPPTGGAGAVPMYPPSFSDGGHMNELNHELSKSSTTTAATSSD